jgi:hypothetical protein
VGVLASSPCPRDVEGASSESLRLEASTALFREAEETIGHGAFGEIASQLRLLSRRGCYCPVAPGASQRSTAVDTAIPVKQGCGSRRAEAQITRREARHSPPPEWAAAWAACPRSGRRRRRPVRTAARWPPTTERAGATALREARARRPRSSASSRTAGPRSSPPPPRSRAAAPACRVVSQAHRSGGGSARVVAGPASVSSSKNPLKRRERWARRGRADRPCSPRDTAARTYLTTRSSSGSPSQSVARVASVGGRQKSVAWWLQPCATITRPRGTCGGRCHTSSMAPSTSSRDGGGGASLPPPPTPSLHHGGGAGGSGGSAGASA